MRANCILCVVLTDFFFPTHRTAQILLPYNFTSLDASEIQSIGKYLGAMTMLLKKWWCGCEFKIQNLNEGIDALVSWRRKAIEYYADYVGKKIGFQQTHLVIVRARAKSYTINY